MKLSIWFLSERKMSKVLYRPHVKSVGCRNYNSELPAISMYTYMNTRVRIFSRNMCADITKCPNSPKHISWVYINARMLVCA